MTYKNIIKYWESFLSNGDNRLKYEKSVYDYWCFCDNKKDADSLAELVIQGIKRGTTSLVHSYEVENEDFPKIGELSIVTDWEGNPKCIIKTIKIDRLKFSDVDEKFAFIEGEGDKSLEYWRNEHIGVFSREAKSLGFEFNEEMEVFFEEFQVIYS